MSLPLIIAAGAAVLLLGKKKSKKKSNGATTTATQSPYGAGAGTPRTAAPAPALSPAVKKQGSGEKNVSRETLQWIQKALYQLGFEPGNFEGIFDERTKQAGWNFQEVQSEPSGLTVDGKPGKATRSALREMLEETAAHAGDPPYVPPSASPPQEGEKYPLKVHGSDPEMAANYRGYTIQSIYAPGPGGPSDGSGKTFVRIFDTKGVIVHEHTRPWNSSQPQNIAREERTEWGIQYGTYWIDREFARG